MTAAAFLLVMALGWGVVANRETAGPFRDALWALAGAHLGLLLALVVRVLT